LTSRYTLYKIGKNVLFLADKECSRALNSGTLFDRDRLGRKGVARREDGGGEAGSWRVPRPGLSVGGWSGECVDGGWVWVKRQRLQRFYLERVFF